MAIRVTRKDVRSGDLLTPGWYVCDIKDVVQEPAKDKSTNTIFTFTPIDSEKGGADCEGISVKKFYINEKGIYNSGMALLTACGLNQEHKDALRKKEVNDIELNERDLVGKRILAFIANTTYEGRVSNEATDFREYKVA